MSELNCAPFIENIPAYALGALDGDDLRALQSHLKTCANCQQELIAFTSVAEGLLLATPPQTPPAALRSRLREQLPSRQPVTQKTTRPRRSWSMFPAAWAFTAALMVFFAAGTLFQFQALQRQQAQLSARLVANQTALAMLAYPDTQTLPFMNAGISGSLLLDQDRNVAALVAWDLPQLEKNQTYQAWLIDPQGGRSSAGIFRPETELPFTSLAILPQADLGNYVGLGVTIEPLGGSDQPTGERVFKVDF